MAGAGAKKRLEENKRHINFLRIWVAAGFLSFLAVRLLLHGSTSTKWHWVGLGLTALVNYVCYTAIAALAAPIYGDKGELLDGGADMGMKGLCSYYHDLLYITSIVQCGAAFFNWFWYVYLVVPCYGLYKLFQHVILPWWSSSSNQQGHVMDDDARRKMERTEKRAQARARKWR